MLFQTIGAFRLIFKKLSSTKKHSNFTDAVLSESSFLMLGADAFILEHQLICQASYVLDGKSAVF